MFSVKVERYDAGADKGFKRGVEFVVARGEAPVLFEFVDGLFDVVAFGIGAGVEMGHVPPARGGRNDGQRARRGNEPAQGVAVVRRVSHHFAGRGQVRGQQPRRLRAIAGLARGEQPVEHVAGPVAAQVQLAGAPASAAADGLRAFFLAAPAACWCTRMLVESSCTWRCRAWGTRRLWATSQCATRSHTPLSRQRAKRTYTRCQ